VDDVGVGVRDLAHDFGREVIVAVFGSRADAHDPDIVQRLPLRIPTCDVRRDKRDVDAQHGQPTRGLENVFLDSANLR
jgi:hypothetical protein